MPWLDSAFSLARLLPEGVKLPSVEAAVKTVGRLGSLRASPRLLVGVCCVQFVVLAVGLLQQLSRVECAISVPTGGPVVVECDTCRRKSLTMRSLLLHLAGACIIACGLFAVRFRDTRLLYVYGTVMLFFSLVIGMTALLTALEAPVLEVAVSGVSEFDEGCLALAEEMLASARDHTTLAGLGCIVDTAGAVFAIRSKELFSCARPALAERASPHRATHALLCRD